MHSKSDLHVLNPENQYIWAPIFSFPVFIAQNSFSKQGLGEENGYVANFKRLLKKPFEEPNPAISIILNEMHLITQLFLFACIFDGNLFFQERNLWFWKLTFLNKRGFCWKSCAAIWASSARKTLYGWEQKKPLLSKYLLEIRMN